MVAIILIVLTVLILLCSTLESVEEKALYDETVRKKEGYKWYVGSFEDSFKNTLYTIAFVAKDKENLIRKIEKFTYSNRWKYDGIIPIQRVDENDLWRVDNAFMKI